ncbi:MAG: GNAT family N-acetyltransferase [Muribaculaceae bacterium]|nr:GNAT family N-acetyltransferase [Muribaculaceae bacterium]
MEIRNLEHTDFDTLFSAFELAFADYEISFEKAEVRSMLTRRAYNPELSFAAFDNGRIVAFTLNGTGMHQGIYTAYDIATGTARSWRNRGLAARLFNHALPFLRSAGIRQYLLEVLQNNNKAIAVYKRMNFEVTREFDCFRQAKDNISFPTLPTADSGCRIMPADTASVRAAQSYCDFCPSWQNSIDSIERGRAGLCYLGAFRGDDMVAYCVFDPTTGDISQIAVRNNCRRQGIATQLLREAVKRMKTDSIKVLNICSDNTSIPAFLADRNILAAGKQYEMLLRL